MNHTDPILAKYQEQKGKSIIEIIEDKLRSDHLGKRNAIKRRLLLAYCKYFDYAMTDRKLRRIYTKNLPIGFCRKGIYLIDDDDEVDKIDRILGKSIDTLKERRKMLKIHRRFLKSRKQGQLDLEFRREE